METTGDIWRRIFGPSAPSSTDPRAFQQERVALYAKFLLVLFGVFYVVDCISALVERGAASVLEPGLLTHLGLVFVYLSVWAWLRRGKRSLKELSAAEIFCTFALCAALVLVLRKSDEAVTPGPAFAVAFAIVARAAMVPSSGRRTLAIGVAATAVAAYGYASRPGAQPEPFFVIMWLLAFTVATAVVSRVIYGLQRQVLEARQLGQYVLEDKLGEGGMGVVYRAQHAMLRRQTAVKLLNPEHVGRESLARFEREVRLTARLSHPNTVTIYDYGRTPDGTFYYAMELLNGADLEEIVAADEPLPASRVVHVLSCVAGALAEAHESGLIHRDIKPANIILCQQGGAFDVPKVVDFGLVKQVTGDAGTEELKDVLKTQANVMLGTPHYMAPEAIQTPDGIDARSDLYAVGAVGYFMLTGQTVFDGNSVIELCVKHMTETPLPPSERLGKELPAALERIILDCLEKSPDNRPQTSAELLERLRDLDIPPWDARSARAWWKQHGPTLQERRSKRPKISESMRTLAVDHDRRT